MISKNILDILEITISTVWNNCKASIGVFFVAMTTILVCGFTVRRPCL